MTHMDEKNQDSQSKASVVNDAKNVVHRKSQTWLRSIVVEGHDLPV